MTARTARWIAWSIVVIYIILAGAGLTLQGLADTFYAQTELTVLIFLVGLVVVWMVTGALIISRHPQHPVGWLLCAGLFFSAVDMFSAGYIAYDTYAYSNSLPGVDFALIWLKLENLAPYGLVAFTLIVLLFPNGRFLSPGWRKVAWIAVGSLLVFLPLQAVEPGPADPLFLPTRINPLGVSASLWAFLKPLMWTMFSILALCYGAAFVSLIVRLRNSHGDVRQQIKWLLFPVGLYGIFLLLFFIGIAKADEAIVGTSIAIGQLAVAGIVISIAFAIFKYRLYDVDLIINRTLVYGTLTACVVGLYVLIVGGAGLVIQNNITLAGLLITAILVGAIYRPMRALLQNGVDRLIYGSTGAPPDESINHSSEIAAGRVEVNERQDQDISTAPAEAVFVQPPARWMRLARMAWYPTFVTVLGIFIFFIIGSFINGPGGIAGPYYSDNSSPWIISLAWIARVLAMLAGLISVFLALLLFWHRSGDRMGLFTSFFLMVYGIIYSGPLEALKTFFPDISKLTEIILPGFVAVLTLCLFAIFPDGRFVPRWTRWVALAAFLTIPIALFWSSLYSQPPVDFSQPVVLISTALIVLLMVAGWISILYAQIYRYRHVSTLQQRQQTKWAVYGMGANFILQMTLTIPWIYLYTLPPGSPLPPWQAIVSTIYALWMDILPVTLTIAVMRYRLYDIDIIINRTLVYGALTAIVVAIYVLVVGVVGTFMHAQGNLLITLLATGLIAVLFQPLREWLQRRVNRLIYGERDDPIEALSRLGKQMEVALPSDQVLPSLVKTIAQTLKLPYVGITLKGQRDISFGQETENPVAFPFVFQGETTGVLFASPRNPGDNFTPGEMRLLQNLARQAGAAVRNAQLTVDLQRSRQTLVTAREEERHRLRRDLHDGIGPTMAGLTLKLDAAKDLVSSGLDSGKREELEEAVQLLRELKSQTQETVRNIRDIVHTLRPPSLDVLGLIPALQAHVGQVAIPNRLTIQMRTSPHPQNFPRLSAAVEVAAYRIVLEAVTNVIQHANAGMCEVSLTLENGNLEMEIKDDGIGLPKGFNHGIGLDSMRERAEELGGQFELSSSPRGTRVCAEIPIAPTRNES
ncbi:MAG TPA: ATP-binding protein [Anaerolineales bacterium]|nr:ATP-binding protein [Anaerolineales bacterium]